VFAARDARCKSLTGWDLSASSLESTRVALESMQTKREAHLAARNIVEDDPVGQEFDSIICSEVLEHTEDPGRALRSMLASLRPGGRIFLNVPVNSPAPDHIYLWSDTADLGHLIADTGFAIDSFIELPPTGKTLALARKYALDISCIVVAHRP
jgi:2-polyprenyl-3-methyl-5-hydroxy-6-metoxy-1,4-benzoquinol methylase